MESNVKSNVMITATEAKPTNPLNKRLFCILHLALFGRNYVWDRTLPLELLLAFVLPHTMYNKIPKWFEQFHLGRLIYYERMVYEVYSSHRTE